MAEIYAATESGSTTFECCMYGDHVDGKRGERFPACGHTFTIILCGLWVQQASDQE